MMLSEVIESVTPSRKKFDVRSKEGNESLRRNTIKVIPHQRWLGRQSFGKSESTLRNTTPVPKNFLSFGTIRDAFLAGQGYGGTRQEQGTYDIEHTPDNRKLTSNPVKYLREPQASKN